ncbi:MAG: lytic transglycosylase domain-containing protein [Desulfobacca sp.]|nr:lytic transglycosylase domain-containing protein [Desulfobacca sp.]
MLKTLGIYCLMALQPMGTPSPALIQPGLQQLPPNQISHQEASAPVLPPTVHGKIIIPEDLLPVQSSLPEGNETKISDYPTPKTKPVENSQLVPLIRKFARVHGVDERLVRAVMQQESGGNPRAVSPKGAMGLMQLMPGTAELMGVKNPFDPEDNLAGGVKYLKQCLNQFKQNVALALAAYNAGPKAVERYAGCPPYQETKNYVACVMKSYTGKTWTTAAAPVTAPEPEPVPEKTGLDWQIPEPTWKIAAPQAKINAPQWKIKPSRLAAVLKAKALQSVVALDESGSRKAKGRL